MFLRYTPSDGRMRSHREVFELQKLILIVDSSIPFADKRAFFAMPMTDSTPQMYEFVATSANEMKQWMKLIAETAKNRVRKALPAYRSV